MWTHLRSRPCQRLAVQEMLAKINAMNRLSYEARRKTGIPPGLSYRIRTFSCRIGVAREPIFRMMIQESLTMPEQENSSDQDRWRQLAAELGLEAESPAQPGRFEEESDVGDFRDDAFAPTYGQEDLDDSSPVLPLGQSERAEAAVTDEPQERQELREDEQETTASDARGRQRRGRRSGRGGRGRRGRDADSDVRATDAAPAEARQPDVAESEGDESPDDIGPEERAHREPRTPRTQLSSDEGSPEPALEYDDELREEEVVEDEEREEVEAAAPREGEEELDEMDDLSDWNVPSWNDLIASLYRPDR